MSGKEALDGDLEDERKIGKTSASETRTTGATSKPLATGGVASARRPASFERGRFPCIVCIWGRSGQYQGRVWKV